jgi:cation diffusion facilitator family transporter
MDQSEKIGFYSIGVNLILVVIKVGLSFLSGSVALFADAIHSATDVISSGTVVAGIKISKRTSRNFPYGLYKVENFVSLLSSVFIFLAGYEIVHTVFFETAQLNRGTLPYAMAGVLLTMAITFAFSRYELAQGKQIGSPSLMADAQHIHTDMLSSGVILAGLIGSILGWDLDKFAALLVVVLIAKAAIAILVDALRVLLDASIDFKTMDQVKTIIMKNPRVVSINALWGRNSGPYKFIEADIVVQAGSLERAHFFISKIEKEIREKLSNVDHILIHYEPRKKEVVTCAIPLGEDKASLADHFGSAPHFYIVSKRQKDGQFISEAYYHNPFRRDEKGKGIKVSEWLIEKGVHWVYSPKELSGRGPGYVFSNAGVEIKVTDSKRLEDIRKDFQES